MLFLNQRKRKNGRRNIFMTKSSRKDVPDARSIAVPLDSQATSLHRYLFYSKIIKNMYTRVQSSFTVGKWGVRGSHLHGYVILMKIQENIS